MLYPIRAMFNPFSKIAFYILLAGFNLVTIANPHKHHDSTSAVHGMVMFGNQQIYLSHLGLYHHPHDHQIVMRAKIANSGDAQRYQKWLTTYSELVTIAPKPFPLSGLDPKSKKPVKSIVADIYEGHFERGGKKKFSDVRLEITENLVYRKLSADMVSEKPSYVRIGKGKEYFLVYKIGPRPDQDHIVQIDAEMNLEDIVKPVFSRGVGQKLSIGKNLISNDKELNVIKEIYFETKDFSF